MNIVHRSVSARVLLCLAFFCAVNYYDPGVNLSFLFYASALLTAAATMTMRADAVESVVEQGLARPLYAACLIFLSLIFFHYLFVTQSPDSSFAASMVLAAGLLAVMITLRVGARETFKPMFWMVAIFALVSTLRYLIWGHRAHDPLLDPSNYVTLLYLAFVPWLHERLCEKRQWRVGGHLTLITGCVVFVVAVLATHSRFGWLVLAILFVYWGLLWSLRRAICGRKLLVCLAGCLIGFSMYAVDGKTELTENISSVAVAAETTSPRLTLLKTTVAMSAKHGVLVGQGLSTFPMYYAQERDPSDQNTAGLYVHSDFVQVLFEGGILMVLPLLMLAGAVLWYLLAGLSSANGKFGHLGYLLALGLALLHAQLNFVIYVLPLAIFVGVVAACAFSTMPIAFERKVSFVAFDWLQGSLLWRLTIGLYFFATAFLALDTFSYGVFAGQFGVPGASWVREDAQRMERFADLNIALNERRGVPRLAKAELKRRALPKHASPSDLAEVQGLYQQAIETDPWNPSAYLRMFDFLHTRQIGGTADQAKYLDRALALAPQDANVAARVIQFYAEVEPARALQLGMQATVWCEFMAKIDRDSLAELGRVLAELNRRLHSKALNDRLEDCRGHYRNTVATQRRATILQNYWFNKGSS